MLMREDIKMLQREIPVDPCEKCRMIGCCGCQDKREWEEKMREYRDQDLFSYAQIVAQMQETKRKIAKLQQEYDCQKNQLPKELWNLIDPDYVPKGKAEIRDAEYTSVWDGGTSVSTPCKVNMKTRKVFKIKRVDLDGVDSLDWESVSLQDENGHTTEYLVAPKEEYDFEESNAIFWRES